MDFAYLRKNFLSRKVTNNYIIVRKVTNNYIIGDGNTGNTRYFYIPFLLLTFQMLQ